MKYPDLSEMPSSAIHLERNPGRTYYCVAWLPGGQLERYESCTTNEERAYSHLNRLRQQGRTEVGMVELDHKPPGVKAPPQLRKQPQGTLFGGDPPDDPERGGGQMGFSFNPDEADVDIEYGVVANGNKRAGGWLPVIWKNGRQHGSTWQGSGYDREDALTLAQEMAREEADRYIGDWNVTVGARETENPAKGLTAKQLEALERLHQEGPLMSWDFGSTTVNRLRKEGLVEDVVAYGSKRLQITDAGLDRLARGNPGITAAERHELAGADFGVPEHEGLPIDTPGRTRAAMARFNQFDFDSNAQKKTAYRRILARARQHGIDPAGFQARWHRRMRR
ncbi:MAG: hypothetical protein KJO40_13460 [Deltaproteobacteria bacterium]|nr:hypothetical protein [Deltaproteobacteria bacterium]